MVDRTPTGTSGITTRRSVALSYDHSASGKIRTPNLLRIRQVRRPLRHARVHLLDVAQASRRSPATRIRRILQAAEPSKLPCSVRDSNPQPPASRTGALPLELPEHEASQPASGGWWAVGRNGALATYPMTDRAAWCGDPPVSASMRSLCSCQCAFDLERSLRATKKPPGSGGFGQVDAIRVQIIASRSEAALGESMPQDKTTRTCSGRVAPRRYPAGRALRFSSSFSIRAVTCSCLSCVQTKSRNSPKRGVTADRHNREAGIACQPISSGTGEIDELPASRAEVTRPSTPRARRGRRPTRQVLLLDRRRHQVGEEIRRAGEGRDPQRASAAAFSASWAGAP